jgi:DNA-binding ferritin-like protein
MRFKAVLAVIVVLAAMLSQAQAIAELSYPPHEDPAAAREEMDAYFFLTHYTGILTLISTKNYSDANRLIEQLKFAYIPEDLKYIIQRYNNLTSELTETLEQIDEVLCNASALMYQYRLREAYEKLSEASILLGKAETLLGDIEDATVAISNRLGVFAAPAESRVREAYDKIQSVLQKLRELENEYLNLLKSIKETASNIEEEELKPTEVTLTLNATKVSVGGPIEALGDLKSNGESLPNRTVTLLLDGEPVLVATTGLDSSYHAVIKLPYKYVHMMTVKALYTPVGDDRGVYLASESPPASISVVFYETRLEAVAPDTAHPGLPITVGGKATSVDGTPLGGRQVKVLLDGALLGEAETNVQGLFETEVTLSPLAQAGQHTLTVMVDPHGVYAGASQDKILNVSKITPEINIRAPSFLILPAGVHIEGEAYSSLGPLEEATVTLELAGSSAFVKTSQDGRFNATMEMPLNLLLAGFQELEVGVEPAEPWHAPVQARIRVFIVNPANIGVASAAFISLGAVIYTRLAKAKPRRKRVPEVTPTLREARFAPTLKPEVRFEGVMGKVLGAYFKAMRTIETRTGISMKPHMTLREFLWEVKPKLDGVADAFTDLTFLAEKTLYSPHVPGVADSLRAEELALTIDRVLAVGAA